MCGLTGWVDFTRDLREERETVDRMTATMERRGPDSAGTWIDAHAAVGHRRLAIIDVDGGTQPFVELVGERRQPVVLAYTGEVYNFEELRGHLKARGHSFRTRSDTEVVLRSYLEWGACCVERFNGMFAFAVWDGRSQELLLVRDRIGIKPLYYHTYPGGILFASEPKGILANDLFKPQVDEASLPVLLNARLLMPGETQLHDLHEVKPGHMVRFERRGAYEHPYWRLVSREHTDDMAATVDTVRGILEDAAKRQLVSDVPLSAMLSGGLDSTLLAAIAAREVNGAGDELTTFSVEFEGDSDDFRPTQLRPEVDGPYARRAAQHLGTDHVGVVLDTGDVIDALPEARRARDLPSLGQFDTSMYLLFRAMRERSTVALSGEAADEIFGGYPWFHDEKTVWRDGFPWMGDAPRLADCLAPDVHARVKPREAEHDRYMTLRAQVPRLDGETGLDARMREVLYFSQQGPLQYLLDRKDRMSMAVGLEVRVPYLDHRLVEYVWNVPWSMKVADGHWKTLLRMAGQDLVPAETLERKKSGYPGTHDARYEHEVMTGVERMLDDPDSPLGGVIDRARIEDVKRAGASTMTWLNPSHLLLPLLEIDTWMRDYGVTFR